MTNHVYRYSLQFYTSSFQENDGLDCLHVGMNQMNHYAMKFEKNFRSQRIKSIL